MKLIKKGKVGDVFFRIEEYNRNIALSIGNKSSFDEGHPFIQVLFSSKEEFESLVKELSLYNNTD